MKCVICRNGETKPGASSLTLERDGKVVVIRGVPAEICDNCGHSFRSSDTSAKVFELAEEVLRAGVEVCIREYGAA